jgi:hypothetical protein
MGEICSRYGIIEDILHNFCQDILWQGDNGVGVGRRTIIKSVFERLGLK